MNTGSNLQKFKCLGLPWEDVEVSISSAHKYVLYKSGSRKCDRQAKATLIKVSVMQTAKLQDTGPLSPLLKNNTNRTSNPVGVKIW